MDKSLIKRIEFPYAMLQNLADRAYGVWADYRYPPKHRQLAEDFKNLITHLKNHQNIKPETTIRRLESIAKEQTAVYRGGMVIGLMASAFGIVTIVAQPHIVNELKEYSEYLSHIAHYSVIPTGAVIMISGLTHFIRNFSLNLEIGDYLREKDQLIKDYIRGPKRIV